MAFFFRSRAQLRSLLRTPAAAEAARGSLEQWDPSALAELVRAQREPWWRRRACARALQGRVPAAAASGLWERVTDEADVTELRVALLDVLTSGWGAQPADRESADARERALTWLRARADSEAKYGLHEALLVARGALGDESAADALASLTFDAWRHRAERGEQGLRALLAAHGLPSLLGHWGVSSVEQLVLAGPSAASRFVGVLWLEASGTAQAADAASGPGGSPTTSAADVTETLLRALEDPDVAVAHRAHLALVRRATPRETLWAAANRHAGALTRAAADQPAPPLTGAPAAACWALVLLHHDAVRTERERGERYVVQERDAEIYDWLMEAGQPRVPLTDVPEDVRAAILREHLPAQRETDPRFHLEGVLLGAPCVAAEHEAMRNGWQAHAALSAAGLSPSPPVPVGVRRRQGSGTYSVLDVGDVEVSVCELGKFVSIPDVSSDALTEDVTRALVAAGFRVIDASLSERVVRGLPVYFFGAREPLSVRDLLFYWQD